MAQIPDGYLALRPRQAAQALGICEKTLWSWTKNGTLPHVRIGRTVLYPVAELQAWLSENANRRQSGTGNSANRQAD